MFIESCLEKYKNDARRTTVYGYFQRSVNMYMKEPHSRPEREQRIGYYWGLIETVISAAQERSRNAVVWAIV